MKSFATACALLFSVQPTMALAQANDNGQYSYCQVEDTGKRDIWVSQVFPTPPVTDLMASDFHRHVGTLGGAGNKVCVTAASRAAAEETRAGIAAIMGKRSFGIRVYDWHDVNWTPGPAAYANAAPPTPVAANMFVYCRFVDADKRVLLASEIFVQQLPPKSDGAHYQELTRYASEFGARAAAAEGVNPNGSLCIGSDTMAEADKSRSDYRKAFPFSGIRKVDLAFRPGPMSTASAPTASAPPASAPPTTPIAATPSPRPVANRPIDPAISQQIASAAFFQVPEGTGDTLRRSGSRIVNKTVPVSTDTTLQRVAGGNQCQLDQDTLAGEGGLFKTRSMGATWAGLVPLNLSSKMSTQQGLVNTEFRAAAFDKLVGQPFPLVAGKTFGMIVSFESIDLSSGAVTRFGQDIACTVGATTAASATIAGMRGEQTELQCKMEFVGLPLPPQAPVFIWYSAAGCFLQDPDR